MQIIILEAVLLAFSISLDSFAASFAYGGSGVKIPFRSVLVVNLVCGGMLALSLLAGVFIGGYISNRVTVFICFGILFCLGIFKLFDSVTKSIIKKRRNFKKELKFSMFNIGFILHLYASPEDADVDGSKTISPAEAAALAVSLSLDGAAAGFGSSMINSGNPAVFALSLIIASLIIGTAAIMSGCFFGNLLMRKNSFNLSWVSGVILIVMAFIKL